jgi:glycosyltransferase involved in cell wall biosynthesis
MAVVIPAHDEAAVLPALLRALDDPDIELIVVCNGCSDGTADVARRACPRAVVLETATPSKVNALRLGEARASVFPIFYLDADIEIDADGLATLAGRLRDRRLHAVAPSVAFDVSGSSPVVRAYYRVLPLVETVARSVAGTGCIGLSEQGRSRFADWPDVLADDYFLDGLFTASEKERVDGVVARVGTPLDVRDLVRRRQRVIWGNRQVDAIAPRPDSGGSLRGLIRMVRRHPRRVVDVVLYAAVGVSVRATLGVIRLRGGTVGWNRDRSRARVQ